MERFKSSVLFPSSARRGMCTTHTSCFPLTASALSTKLVANMKKAILVSCVALSFFCGAALSQAQIPERGPIPDDRGFQPADPARVAKVKAVVRHIQGQTYV